MFQGPQSLLIILFAIVAVASPFICPKNDTESCSYQWGLADLSNNSCLVHPTYYCSGLAVSSDPPLRHVETEEATFEIRMASSLTDYSQFSTNVNISLKTKNKEISSFFVFIQQERNPFYNLCRVFDFTEVKRLHPAQEVDLYYDCLRGLDVNRREYDLIVRATPINKELKYKLYVPTFDEIQAFNICNWRPLSLMNMASLSIKKIDIMFTPVISTIISTDMVEEYTVIVECGGNVKKVGKVLPPQEKMQRVTVHPVASGHCSVSIAFLPGQANCKTPEKLFTFTIPNEPDIPSFPWYYLMIAFVVFLFLIALLYYIVKNYKVTVLSRPKVLLLYSNDSPEHLDVVIKLYEFLKVCCSVEAILDWWDMRNKAPQYWVMDAIQNVNHIILVVSEGVKHKIDHDNKPPINESGPWDDCFTPAYRWLLIELNGKKPPELSKVIFTSYCQESLVPRKLKYKGRNFFLLKDLNRFLCHLHRSSLSKFLCLCPILPGSQYTTYTEGQALAKALRKMSSPTVDNPHCYVKLLSPLVSFVSKCLRDEKDSC